MNNALTVTDESAAHVYSYSLRLLFKRSKAYDLKSMAQVHLGHVHLNFAVKRCATWALSTLEGAEGLCLAVPSGFRWLFL